MKEFDTELYYWSNNRYAYYIVFREPENKIGIRVSIKFINSSYFYRVEPPDHWVGEGFSGNCRTLGQAMEQANHYINIIIKEEFV